MLKTAYALVVSIFLLFAFTSDSMAFDFAGLKGTDRDDPDRTGKIEDVNWPPEFVAESEAIQASMIKKLSAYQNWEFSRTLTVSRLEDDGREFFEDKDQILPISNKCEEGDASKTPVFASEYLAKTIGNTVNMGAEDKAVYTEYFGEFRGSGWNCKEKITKPYWRDRRDVFEAGDRPLKRAEDTEKNSTDSMVIIDFLARTRDLNHKFKLDDNSNALFDRWGGRTYDALLEGRNFIITYCVCKEDEKEDVFSKVGKFFAPKN